MVVFVALVLITAATFVVLTQSSNQVIETMEVKSSCVPAYVQKHVEEFGQNNTQHTLWIFSDFGIHDTSFSVLRLLDYFENDTNIDKRDILCVDKKDVILNMDIYGFM